MPSLNIDGRAVEVPEGATVLDAARRLGVDIPTLCHHPDFAPSTSCMACVVRIDGARNLVPSCATIAAEGMEVESDTEEVRAARRVAIELLMSDHAGDCVAPCQRADALHVDVPLFLRQVATGQIADAAGTLEASGLSLDDPAALDFTRAEKACRRGRFDESVDVGRIAQYVVGSLEAGVSGHAPPTTYRQFTVHISKLSEEEMAELLAGATEGDRVPPADAAGGAYSAEEARLEASRCAHCDCRMAHDCVLRDAAEAYEVKPSRYRAVRPSLEQDRSHSKILHEPGKCIRCGLCLQVAERAGEPVGLSFVGRGFEMNVKVPFGSPLSEALALCAEACADVCPTGSLARVDAPPPEAGGA